MTRIHFEEIFVTATHRWVDADGKKRQKTRRFYQTINPYNKLPNGRIKAAEDIQREIVAERDEWVEAMREATQGAQA